MLVVGLSLLILTGEGLVHTGSWGWIQDLKTTWQREVCIIYAATEVTPSSPLGLLLHQVFSKSLVLQSFMETMGKIRQANHRGSLWGYQRQWCKHKTLSPHFQVHTKEVSGVCMLWLIHQVVKTKRFISPFWLLADHLCPPKAGGGLQTAFLWDSVVKWDLQYFCVSERWVGIFKKKQKKKTKNYITLKKKQF